jgi:glutathione S-transferase
MPRTLYGLPYSPWTHRALFALDHHAIAYRFVEHVPMLGELRLRRITGHRRPTVPVLVSGTDVLMGSSEIARLADREGAGSKLFPEGKETGIAVWEAHADQILSVARMRVMGNLRQSPKALAEALPPFVPGPFRPMLRIFAKQAIDYLAKKHDVAGAPDTRLRKEVFPVFDALEKTLASGSGHESRATIFEELTFADLAMASAVSGFFPTKAEPGTTKMRAATLACWTCDELVEKYPRVYAWRDRIYEAHRFPSPRSA